MAKQRSLRGLPPPRQQSIRLPLPKQPVKTSLVKTSLVKTSSVKTSLGKTSSVKTSLRVTSSKSTKTVVLPKSVKSSPSKPPTKSVTLPRLSSKSESVKPQPEAPTGVSDSDVNPIILKLISDVEKALSSERLGLLQKALGEVEELSEQQSALIFDVIHNLAVRFQIDPKKLWDVPEGPDLAVLAAIGDDRLVDAYLQDLIESHVWGGWLEAEAATSALGFYCDVYAQQPVGNPTLIIRLHRDCCMAPRSDLALLYDGAHYRAYDPMTHAITENGGGGDCLYEALLHIARSPLPVRVLRSMTATRLRRRKSLVRDAIVLLQFENNPEHAIGPNLRALLEEAWLHEPVMKSSEKSDERSPMEEVPRTRFQIKGLAGNKSGTTNVLGPYRTKRTGVETEPCTVIIAGGRSLELFLTAEERKLFRKNAHFYVVPDTLIHYGRDDDATWADLIAPKTERAARYGIELQLNKTSLPFLSVGTALDAAENGHKPIWGSRLRVHEGREKPRDAFHISLDSLGFGAVLEVVVTHVSGGNLQAFFHRVGPVIAKALAQFGQNNPYLYRTGNLSEHSYRELEGGFRGSAFAKSYSRDDAKVIGQVTTTLTVDEIRALKARDLPRFENVEQVYAEMRQQATRFQKSHSKSGGALIKNAMEQFTEPNYLAPETIIHKNPVTVKDRLEPVYLTFGGNKVGYRFQRANKAPAFLIEFRERTTIGPALTNQLALAIRGKRPSVSLQSELETLGLPIVTADRLEFDEPEDS